jgi:hypothetical protein
MSVTLIKKKPITNAITYYGQVLAISDSSNTILNLNDEWEIIYPEIDIYKAFDEVFLNKKTIQSVLTNKKYNNKIYVENICFEPKYNIALISNEEYNGKWRVVE